MKTIKDLKLSERMLLNSALVAGIVLLSNLVTAPFPPTPQTLYGAALGALIALATQLKTATADDKDPQKPKNPGLLMLV